MGQVTLGQLRLSVRQMADCVNSQRVTDSEVNDYINREAAQLHNEFGEAAEDYWLTDTTFTLDGSGTPPNAFTLPADFWKLRGLDYQIDAGTGSWRELRQFSFNRRNDMTPDIRRYFGTAPERKYRLVRNALWIIPETEYSGTYRLWYTTLYAPMVTDSDAIPDWEGSHELVILGAAIRALDKDESEASHLRQEREMLRERIQMSIRDRNAGEADVVQDRQGYGGGLFGVGGGDW